MGTPISDPPEKYGPQRVSTMNTGVDYRSQQRVEGADDRCRDADLGQRHQHRQRLRRDQYVVTVPPSGMVMLDTCTASAIERSAAVLCW